MNKYKFNIEEKLSIDSSGFIIMAGLFNIFFIVAILRESGIIIW